MSTQLLFYKEAIPVSKEQHAVLSIDTTQDYSFASGVNSVPLTATEFPFAARDYVIVFAGPETPIPAAILGVQQDRNVFVSTEGKWEGRYIPAFVRRYPFVFSSNEDSSTFTLCVDKEFKGLNEDGRGVKLFSDEGENTPYLDKMLNFLQEYQLQFQRTQAFCQKLKEFELLESMQAHFSLPSGSQQSLTGFQVISRDRLKALDADQLAELAKSDALELAYLHVFPYSQRSSTSAAKRWRPLADHVVHERARRMRELDRRLRRRYQDRFVGRRVSVLFESSRDRQSGLLKGYSDNYLPVECAVDDGWAGRVAQVEITGRRGARLVAALP